MYHLTYLCFILFKCHKMYVMVDLPCMAGRETVAVAGALAGPQGWSCDVTHVEKL